MKGGYCPEISAERNYVSVPKVPHVFDDCKVLVQILKPIIDHPLDHPMRSFVVVFGDFESWIQKQKAVVNSSRLRCPK